MALGARPHDVIRLIAHRVTPLLGVGILSGAALSASVSVWVRALLYRVQPFDVTADATAMLLVILIGVAGAFVPTFRAMRVEPSSTLRQE